MMQLCSRPGGWTLALCTIALGGCGGDSTGPAGNLSDPAALSADLQSLDTPFESSVMQGFGAVALSSGGTPATRAASFLAALSPAGKLPSADGAVRRQSSMPLALRTALSTGPNFQVIPSGVWGKVYEWDVATDHYVESVASGPANGVRFILYAVNPLTEQPNEPLDPVGYADFLDESNGATDQLRVRVVGDDAVTYADYVVSGTTGGTSLDAAISGFVTNGTRRLDFTADLAATSSQVQLQYQLQLDQPAVSAQLQLQLQFSGESATMQLNFNFTHGGETLELQGTLTLTSSASGSSATASFTVDVNGGRFATITGSSSGNEVSYTFTGPGRELTAAEREALGHLFAAPSEMGDFIEQLFGPVEAFFGDYSAAI
ncbi:MAG TPA: hypothetical protein VFM14_13905 [Gemmatimonadales bacterium]|nr:hypothetical protein [Gemmatimonadales bacterium]